MTLEPHQLSLVRELEFRPEDLRWERKPGQVELNPLLLARIAERVQFDGDVPELRFGNLPEGGKPAVPVEADTTDPVLLGLMLQWASSAVLEELQVVRRQWELGEEAKGELAKIEDMPIFAVPGYVPGQVPARRTADVQPSDMANLSFSERQEAAFLSVATTQGRVSALTPIVRLVKEGLEQQGLEVLVAEGETILAQSRWTLSISQSRDVNPNFSPLATAAKALVRDLLRGLPEGTSRVCVSVQPINTVHDRVVGWTAVVYG